MAFEHNVEHLTTDVAKCGRDISARRAATIANMIDEAKKQGLESDEFARAAIRTYGAARGQALRSRMDDPDSFEEFKRHFGHGYGREIYENEITVQTDDTYVVEFHYCPYVAEWVRQGRSPEEISNLCEVAMEGDHEFARQFPCMTFHLDKTIADGDPVCRLRFERKR